jgi:septal ring factor EnvC (AmiA/AmiB activator)
MREGQTVISWPGIDMWVPGDTPVTAVKPGKVIYSDSVKGLGHVIVLDHGDDLKSVYAKLRDPRVQVGDQIAAGTALGTVIAVAAEEDTNFLFSLNRAGRPVDPARWLRRR